MTMDAGTIAFYDREAGTYGKWAEEFGLPDHFQHFARTLPKGAAVLDFGCGGGWAAKAFHAQGCKVTALDPSQGMIAEIAKTPGIDTICGQAADIAPRRFDAIWAHFSLQHIPREDLPAVLDQLAAALIPSGRLFVGIHEGTKTHRDSLDRLYNHYTEPDLRGLLLAAGFTTDSLNRAKDKSYDGHPIEVMNLEAHKHA